ncbi:hypothetical protein ASL71_16305 [Salmonella enterica subsp. enterica serovar Isangi]|nr:hypothetical protein [Salmonella enterica]EBH8422461.1 hypothetical protein [Salmonella enterica subsp. enterica serovar Isangi]ECG2028114.1 hypothetical protein [Salmonella enterica subsp. enterica serovar Hato]ECI3890138.1 hypothetical protein [Salmonella enterica subsp. enterica serovar Gombe]EBY7748405.1 hypothetical protein [Salmonella enterica subsp. enterica serovar Isangi]
MNRLSGLPLSRKPDKRNAIRQSVPDGGLNALSGLLVSLAPFGEFSSYLSQQLVLLYHFSATIINNLNR